MVTIIVLLILAGISIMMLTGNNGILTRAGQAKKEMDLVTVKEQAEMIKGGAYINKKYDNKELSKKDLLTEIANDKYFKDSVKLNDKVITANDKYKIEVDDNLNITVSEYKNEIEIEYSVENLEYGARITITPKFKNRDTIPTYEEYKTETLNNIQTDDDLKEIYVKLCNSDKNYKYYFVYVMKAIENIDETITWEKIEKAYIKMYENQLDYAKTNYPSYTEEIQSMEQQIEQLKQNGVTAQMIMEAENLDQAKEKLVAELQPQNKSQLKSLYDYEYSVTVSLNGDSKNINLGESKNVTYWINKNQNYAIDVKANNNQEGYKIANVTEIENFLPEIKKAICFNGNMYVLTNDSKFIKIDSIEYEQNTDLYKIGGESNFNVLANNIRDFSCYTLPSNLRPNAELYIINNNDEVFKMDYTNEQENFNTKVNENVLQIEGMYAIIHPNQYSRDYYYIFYVYNNEPESIYKDTTKIAENVDQFFYDSLYPYYVTKSNELYRIIYNRNTQNIETEKIAENVRTIKDSHYLTIDNKLYKDNNEKVKDNVQKIGCGLYITNNNEIYKIPSSTGDNNYNNKVDIEIKELNKDYLITNDDLIYVDYIYNWMY